MSSIPTPAAVVHSHLSTTRHPKAVLRDILADPGLSHGAVRLWLLLCAYTSPARDVVTASPATLSRQMGIQSRQLRRLFVELEAEGLVARISWGRPVVRVLVDVFDWGQLRARGAPTCPVDYLPASPRTEDTKRARTEPRQEPTSDPNHVMAEAPASAPPDTAVSSGRSYVTEEAVINDRPLVKQDPDRKEREPEPAAALPISALEVDRTPARTPTGDEQDGATRIVLAFRARIAGELGPVTMGELAPALTLIGYRPALLTVTEWAGHVAGLVAAADRHSFWRSRLPGPWALVARWREASIELDDLARQLEAERRAADRAAAEADRAAAEAAIVALEPDDPQERAARRRRAQAAGLAMLRDRRRELSERHQKQREIWALSDRNCTLIPETPQNPRENDDGAESDVAEDVFFCAQKGPLIDE